MAETKVANPGPLGLAGFGLTTIVLSCMNAGLFPPEAGSVVVPLAFCYGGLAQIIAGVMEYRNGNTFGTVALTFSRHLLVVVCVAVLDGRRRMAQATTCPRCGLTLLLWGVFTFYLWIVTFRLNRVLWLVFLTLWIAFFLLAASDLGMGATWHKLGGWDGLLCGSLALYLSSAEVTNTPGDAPRSLLVGP